MIAATFHEDFQRLCQRKGIFYGRSEVKASNTSAIAKILALIGISDPLSAYG
jgi:hypothetical protein